MTTAKARENEKAKATHVDNGTTTAKAKRPTLGRMMMNGNRNCTEKQLLPNTMS